MSKMPIPLDKGPRYRVRGGGEEETCGSDKIWKQLPLLSTSFERPPRGDLRGVPSPLSFSPQLQAQIGCCLLGTF